MPGLDDFPTPNRLIRFLYSIGLGFLLGRMILLLTTTRARRHRSQMEILMKRITTTRSVDTAAMI